MNAMLQCENQISRTSKDPDEDKWKRCIADQVLGAINEQQKGAQHLDQCTMGVLHVARIYDPLYHNLLLWMEAGAVMKNSLFF
jgi:hypothetical protein